MTQTKIMQIRIKNIIETGTGFGEAENFDQVFLPAALIKPHRFAVGDWTEVKAHEQDHPQTPWRAYEITSELEPDAAPTRPEKVQRIIAQLELALSNLRKL
jgi:hypothetical protein